MVVVVEELVLELVVVVVVVKVSEVDVEVVVVVVVGGHGTGQSSKKPFLKNAWNSSKLECGFNPGYHAGC